MLSPLRVESGRIVDGNGRTVTLRGVNVGNWLMLEGYMLGGLNEPERTIRRALARRRGAPAARKFFRDYQDVFIDEGDLRRIRGWGFNALRVPFNHKLFDGTDAALYAQSGFAKLDWLVDRCERLGLYCVLDLHGAPGAQNPGWHSDSDGRVELWRSPRFRRKAVELWAALSRRYRGAAAVAGYDLLNEPIPDRPASLNKFYADCLRAVRSGGDRRIVFLEGTGWAQDLDDLAEFSDENLAYSVHFYEPHLYTFNFELDLRYPGRVRGRRWDRAAMKRALRGPARYAARRGRPVLAGEFGINTRCPVCHAESRWVRDAVSVFEELGFHWTYWSYKVLSGGLHPSGLLRFPANPGWLNRNGVKFGWAQLVEQPAGKLREALRDLRSRNFTVDEPVLKALRAAAKRG